MPTPHITAERLALIFSALALLVSFGSFTVSALAYRRGRPRLSAKLKVSKPICWSHRIPRVLDVDVEIENRGSTETSVDCILFYLSANVDNDCVETDWDSELHGKFEPESLKGFHTFRRKFRVPIEMPEGDVGNPSIFASVTLGTNKTLTTRRRPIHESALDHFPHFIEERHRRRNQKTDQ